MNIESFRKVLLAIRTNHSDVAKDILKVLDREIEIYIHRGPTDQFRQWVNCTINIMSNDDGRIVIDNDRLSVLSLIVTGKTLL